MLHILRHARGRFGSTLDYLAETARALLTAAFCRETLAVVGDAGLRELLAKRLDAALARLEAA